MLPSTLSHIMTFTVFTTLTVLPGSEVTGPACMLAICRGADSMEEVRGRAGSWPGAGTDTSPGQARAMMSPALRSRDRGNNNMCVTVSHRGRG